MRDNECDDPLMHAARVEANKLATTHGEPFAIIEQRIPQIVGKQFVDGGVLRAVRIGELRELRVQPADWAISKGVIVEIVGMHDGMARR